MACPATRSTFLGPYHPQGSSLRLVMRLTRVVPIFLVLVSCLRAPSKNPVFNDLADPRDELRVLLRASYEAMQRRDADKLMSLLAPDAVVFGLGPSDAFNFRDTALEALKQLPAEGKHALKITPGRMPVGLAAGGQSAWLWDFPQVEAGGAVYLPRITAHAIREGEAWRFDAIHCSLGVRDALIYASDASKKFVAPSALAGANAKSSEALIELTGKVLDDVIFKLEHTGDAADVVLLGTDPGEVFEGGAAFKAMAKPKLAEIKKSAFDYRVDGPVRARVAPDGRTGWVAANVVLRVGSGRRSQTLPAFRTLWVYELIQGHWALVSEHQSVALRDEQRDPATPDQVSAHDARERRAAPFAAKVREAADGGFGTFE